MKILALIGGTPMIGHVIQAAMFAESLDLVVVSTEDEDIASVARGYEIRVIDRPAEFASDSAPSIWPYAMW